MEKFILDTNFFIQAHRMHYPMDVMPSFWERVCGLARNGQLVSIDKVRNEIVANEDELSSWCASELDRDFFIDTMTVIEHYSRVVQWAVSQSLHYKSTALDEFLDTDEADAWLAAYAMEDPAHRIIVTHETSQPGRRNKIKLPDVCNAFGIQFVNTIELFRRLKIRL